MGSTSAIAVANRDRELPEDEQDQLKAFHLGWTLADFRDRVEVLRKQATTLCSEGMEVRP